MADSNDEGKKYKFFKPISSIKKLVSRTKESEGKSGTKESKGRHNTIFFI